MLGFDAIRGQGLKYGFVMGYWFRGFVKKNWGLSYTAAIMLMMMGEMGRPFKKEELDYMNKATSRSQVSRDLMMLEAKGFVRSVGYVEERYRSPRKGRGRKAIRSSTVSKIQHTRYEVTDAGDRVNAVLRDNVDRRVKLFGAIALSDYDVY